jgi:hypothetical protein
VAIVIDHRTSILVCPEWPDDEKDIATDTRNQDDTPADSSCRAAVDVPTTRRFR